MSFSNSGPTDAELVRGARDGEASAWDGIVQRYQPLVDGIARRHRLDREDGADVSQQVWVRLVENVDRLRTPEALPGWIATTATRACLAVLKQRQRIRSIDPTDPWAMDREIASAQRGTGPDQPEVDDELLRAERQQAIREGLSGLSASQQQLLMLLVADPPLPYTQISDRTGMPVGSIGPTRARLLKKLGQRVAVQLTEEPTRTRYLAAA